MVSIQYANAMAETLYYLKGIREEDIRKIPKKFMSFLEENASKEYICNFDYTKPLKELQLQDETRGIISSICLNYWCDTEEQKSEFMRKLRENEDRYQEESRVKYNPDDIFNNVNTFKSADEISKSNALPVEIKKEKFFHKLIIYIKSLFFKKEK